MNTKTDEGLYEKARKLFISKASIDEFAGWATPRQVDAVHRLLDTELANRERAKHDRLLRRARFPVVKGLDGHDFTNVRLPDGYMLDELLGLGFIPRAQDLVFYGKTGRGKTHLAIGLGMLTTVMTVRMRRRDTPICVLDAGACNVPTRDLLRSRKPGKPMLPRVSAGFAESRRMNITE